MTTTSEARINANRQNATRSTGPKTTEGKERSRQNSLKHGLTGAGVVVPQEDAAEIERRFETISNELRPSGEISSLLIRRVATLSVRLERSVLQETAALSERVRQAEAAFEAPEGASPTQTEMLRAEAGHRALFDPSKDAANARKYEAAAERGLFRALKEIRQVEKEAKAAAESELLLEPYDERPALGSFLPVEPIEPILPNRPVATPSRPAPTPVVSPSNQAFEVPITIGRPR